jgi:hypothetical protein
MSLPVLGGVAKPVGKSSKNYTLCLLGVPVGRRPRGCAAFSARQCLLKKKTHKSQFCGKFGKRIAQTTLA